MDIEKPTYRAIGGKELRDLLCTVLADGTGKTSHEIYAALRARGVQPRGADYKGRIKNLHGLASRDDRIVKVRAGVFALLGDDTVTEPKH